MRKILLLLLLQSLMWGFTTKMYKTTLISAGPKFGYIKDNPSIELNSSGIIMHKLGKYSTIVARAKVVEKKNNLAKVEFKIFKMLAQRAMPTPIIMPKKGDTLILNYLYDRVVIVAPNRQSYRQILRELQDKKMDVVSSDLLAAYLIDVYSKIATRKTLRGFCRANAVGTLVIALKKKAYLFDCINFDKLANLKVDFYKGQQKPFYSNITRTRGEIIKIFENNMGDYYFYYKQLIDY